MIIFQPCYHTFRCTKIDSLIPWFSFWGCCLDRDLYHVEIWTPVFLSLLPSRKWPSWGCQQDPQNHAPTNGGKTQIQLEQLALFRPLDLLDIDKNCHGFHPCPLSPRCQIGTSHWVLDPISLPGHRNPSRYLTSRGTPSPTWTYQWRPSCFSPIHWSN